MASVWRSANSLSPRIRSSGSPPNGNPNPPSIGLLSSITRNVRADAEDPLHRGPQRADRLRARRLEPVRGHRRPLRLRNAATARRALLQAVARGAKPRDDARPVPPRLG